MPPDKKMIDCEFLYPINLGGEVPDWEYSALSCTNSEVSLIQNAETGAEFYIDQKFTYGDILTSWFLTLIFIGLIFVLIFHFFWRR
jgi:hypothetical protein